MESSTRKRLWKNNKEDRISTLPDLLLQHILSFMDTLQVVRTCILSKRWMHLWKSHSYLNFDYETFSSRRRSNYKDLLASFTDFVTQVLVRRNDSEVVKLCFSLTRETNNHCLVESLIHYAVKHHVEEIFINGLLCCKPIVFPSCSVNCESLRSLTLKPNPFPINLPKLSGLPSLKTLHLGATRQFDGKAISSCPNLEYLVIEEVRMNSITDFSIHAPMLKRLEILNWKDDRNIIQGCKVMVFAPKLTHFKFEGNVPIMWSEARLTALDDVYVDLWEKISHISDEDDSERFSLNLIKMLNEFQNAKSLTLSMNIIEILSEAPATLYEDPSPFTNLEYLKLKTDPKDVALPAHILNYFLRSSSMLKVCF